jgi:hypothetical protein
MLPMTSVPADAERPWRVPPAHHLEPAAAPPTFSVIIAAYQAAHMVASAVTSALAQTVAPHEIIVSDDGSTDDLEEALAPFLGRVRLLRNPHGGEGAAKNAGARAATGDFVLILDADDEMTERRVEALTEMATARPDLDLLTTDAWYVVDGQRTRRAYSGPEAFPITEQLDAILQGNFINGAAAIRREALLAAGGFDPSIRQVADWHCWIRLMLRGSRAGLVAEPLYLYTIHDSSLSADRARHLRARVDVLEDIARRDDLPPHAPAVLQRAIAHHDRRARLAEAQRAVRDGAPDAHRRSFAVARDSGFDLRTRAKALTAALLPTVVRAVAARRAPDEDPRTT